jgi:hypothetical protein
LDWINEGQELKVYENGHLIGESGDRGKNVRGREIASWRICYLKLFADEEFAFFVDLKSGLKSRV